MKFSLSWLKAHLDTTATLNEITDALVAIGIEVEYVEDPSERLKGLVVGHVITREQHPNADRLSLCTVQDGTMTDGKATVYQVVCGAPNVRADMKVAFARCGAVIPDTGLPLKKGSIRGVESLGMLCSSRELLLGEDSDGIMDLDATLETGADLAISLGMTDPIIDVSLTPNKSDCFSVYGIARDLAAFGIGTLKDRSKIDVKTSVSCDISVTITDPNTRHFCIRTIKGVKNTQSPAWVQERLRAAGCKPISALVDATNLICLEYGHPLHVFDLNKLQGNALTIHEAAGGETLVALNDKEYTLSQGMTVISDASGVISLAGVMGGASTGCDGATTDVVIESALFDAARIALTGQSTAILSDARTRFERGVDPADTMFGLDYATQLILEWCGGSASDVVQAGAYVKELPAPITVSLSQSRLTSVSGDNSITLRDALAILIKLGFSEKSISNSELTVTVPTWRYDVTLDVDLIEEVLRMRGYDAIPEAALPLILPANVNVTRERLNTLLTSRGYNEAYTWSFIAKETADLFGKGIALSKPLNAEMAMLRPSVLPGLLKIAANAQKRSQPNSSYFEYAPQFHETEKGLIEVRTMTGLRVFSKAKRHWQKAESAPDIYVIKNDVMAALDLFGLSNVQIEAKAGDYYHPGRSGVIKQGPKVIAHFGEIHPSIVKEMGINGVALGFELLIDALPLKQKDKKAAFTPAVYQSVSRDFAFWVDQSVSADQLIKILQKSDRDLIDAIHIFDVYSGDKAPQGQKSIAIEVTLQPKRQTLTDEELMSFQNKVIADVNKMCGGRIRDA
ncbi:MAG: phenylalanine--tRNA ligase subunit beta [Candidatus Paracaedibacteraceae bacterium]|nr:phenylalanine--tRNA ligase subunit beta [Candidatus Paracaedibacteraceae bacterium]